MRTRKMRFVSAVLALAMMFLLVPVGAFAADVKYVKNLTFNGDGPNLDNTTTKANGTKPVTYTPNDTTSGWEWQYGDTCYRLSILSGYTYDSTQNSNLAIVPCEVRAIQGSTIADGYFPKKVYNMGVVTGGHFEDLEIRGNATVTGGYINNCESQNATWGGKNVNFNGGIVYGKFDFEMGTLTSGILCDLPDTSASSAVKFNANYQTLTASGGKITPIIDGEDVPPEVVFQGKVYLVGDNVKTRKFRIEPNSPTFREWKIVSGEENATITKDTDKSWTVELKGTGDVEIKAIMDPFPLTIGEVDGKKVPVYTDGTFYAGSDLDGWYYDLKNNTLTVYENGSIDLGSEEVDWTIDNFGTIEGGKFKYQDDVEKDTLTNEESGKIVGGTYDVIVKNLGTIEDGTFKQPVSNYGKVYGGTFADRYSNTPTKETNSDNTTVVVADGQTYGGVFSRYADFDVQDGVNIRWLTVNGGTVNGAISGLSGVVGRQTITVAADDTTAWTGWNVTSDDPDFALNDYQKTHPEFELELNGDDAAKGSILLNALIKDGYYRIRMEDGAAYNAEGDKITSAKPGEKVTVRLDTSAVLEGMKFGQWIVSPSELELEGFDPYAQEATFTMPAAELSIRANFRTEGEDDGIDAMTVVAGVAVGAGVAYLGYQVGTEVYAEQVLGKGVAIPRTREEVALKAWELAGKPAVELNGEPLSEAAQAEKWAVESGLMQNVGGSFNGSKKMSKLKALRTLDAAKKLG